MQWSIHKTFEGTEYLANEWNDLLACSASHVPFLRYEYQTSWWKTRGGGEWSESELFLVIARDDEGVLAGVAPLFRAPNSRGENAIMLVGSIEISDYLDFICQEGNLAEFFEGLLKLIIAEKDLRWDVIELYNLLENSPSLPILNEKAAELGLVYQQEHLQHCPFIPLPGDWEIYLANINKKQRHEIRRKIRRAEENTVPVNWYFIDEGEKLESAMDAFMDLMAQDPQKATFLTPMMRQQMQLASRAAFEAGWLQLSFLDVGGIKAAGYLNFDYDGHIWVYNSGLSQEFRELSPGWVLLGYLLQWANENHRVAFDFMRGDEEYKYRFGAVDRFVVKATITRPNA